MATFHQFRMGQWGLESTPTKLYCKFTVGAVGAPTLVTASSKGTTSIVRNSAGDYTVTLDQPFVSLLDADVLVQNATGIAGAPVMGIKAGGTNVNTSTGGTIEIVFSTGGVATDLASGDTVLLAFTLKNSNL